MLAPEKLTDRAEEIREAVRAELERTGRYDQSAEPAIGRYARTLDLAWRCWEAVPATRVVGKTDRGGQRVHPAITAALTAEKAAAGFGQALGIEPKAAGRQPGRPLGVRSAPDRKEPPKITRIQDIR